MKRVISANFLERIADPTSRFYPDYLAYRNGEITRAELIDRLPQIAMIGDSVCLEVYISSAWSTFRRARSCRGANWFLDFDPSPESIRSVSKRLEKFTPLVAIQYAGVGALVDHQGERQNFFRRILGTRNFSGQLTQLLAATRFPDLILISIGHNSVDWAWRSPPSELEQPEERLRRQSKRFREDFAHQLWRLIKHARMQRHRVAILVYGLVNFGSYFKAREMAECFRAREASLYPHLETTYKYFTSFRPAYRGNLIRLANMMNDELRVVVAEFNRELKNVENVQLRYSDALATVDLSRVELLHAVDGWHPSAEGHNVVAEAAFGDLGPSLNFLGLN